MAKFEFAGFGLMRGGPLRGFDGYSALTVACVSRLGLDAAVLRALGTVLVLVAAGMWFLPGSQTDTDLVVMKLGASLFFLLTGIALMIRFDEDRMPAACFDPIRREVRVLTMAGDGQVRTVLRRGYDSLGRVQFRGRTVGLYDVDGQLLMRLSVQDDGLRRALRDQLSRLMTLCN